MKILYLNLNMGAAGDMLCAALYQLLDEPGRAGYLRQMEALKLPGVEIIPVQTVRCGIVGTHMKVTVGGVDEGAEHEHGQHSHHEEEAEGRSHVHRSMRDIEAILQNLPLSDRVRANALEVYRSIAQAEAIVHGTEPGEIHFHEVGACDAIADIAGFCLLMEMLAPGAVYASPVRVGSGSVRCAHGILPVPAPATEILLRGIPIRSGDFDGQAAGELCTPTGAALLRHFVKKFGPMPDMVVEKTGYGMGTKDYPVLNAVCASLGESATVPSPAEDACERVMELSCNLDDMTPEDIGYARTVLTDAGALDVWTVAIGMKKSRPGVMLSLLCPADQAGRFADLMLRHTTTLGVRMTECRRRTLERSLEQVDTPYGKLTVKRATGDGINRVKPEFDDLTAMARKTGLSLPELRAGMEKRE